MTPPQDWSGQLLGNRYEIRKLLGKNTGRRTFLAEDRLYNKPVVVKLLLFGEAFSWADLRLFQREAAVLKSLDHAAIPQYLDDFEVDRSDCQGFALVQTYVAAPTLAEQVRYGRTFTEAELQTLAAQLLDILAYLHQQSPPLIHRDLKPSNILLADAASTSESSMGALYLVDFGSVQGASAPALGTITVVGTYGYMPPEQFGGRAVPASDFYSLGATLIYLATGQHPSELPQQAMRLQFEPFARHLSPGFRHWLRGLVEPDIGQRPATAALALDTLQALNRGGLSPPQAQNVRRPMMVRHPEGLDILLPALGFRLRRPGAWLSLLWIATAFTVGSGVISAPFAMVSAFFVTLAWPLGIAGFLVTFALSTIFGAWVAAQVSRLFTPALLWQTRLLVSPSQIRVEREMAIAPFLRHPLWQCPTDGLPRSASTPIKNCSGWILTIAVFNSPSAISPLAVRSCCGWGDASAKNWGYRCKRYRLPSIERALIATPSHDFAPSPKSLADHPAVAADANAQHLVQHCIRRLFAGLDVDWLSAPANRGDASGRYCRPRARCLIPGAVPDSGTGIRHDGSYRADVGLGNAGYGCCGGCGEKAWLAGNRTLSATARWTLCIADLDFCRRAHLIEPIGYGTKSLVAEASQTVLSRQGH
jgi:serine/threonine protein kinase